MIIARWLSGAAVFAVGIFFGCRTSSSSDVNIVGGAATNRYDGSVVRVLVDQARRRYCTAVAVDPNTLLMAAHCIKGASLESSVFAELRAGRDGLGPIKAQRYYSWSAVRNREVLTDQAAARDLAVVVFEGDPFKGPFLRLAPEAAQGASAPVGSKIKIVGFGASTFSLDATVTKESGAQEGTNEIAAAEQGLYILTADLSPSAPKEGNAAAAAGDAGGPLLNDRDELLGLGAGVKLLQSDKKTSTGVTEDQSRYAAARPEGAAFAQNSFVDLGSEASRKLLAYAISTEKKLGREIKIGFSDPQTGDIAYVAGPKELTLSLDDTSWLEDSVENRSGQWVAATGRFVDQTAPSSASLALLEASSQSCVTINGQTQCDNASGPNSASTSIGGGPGGGWSAPQGGGNWAAPGNSGNGGGGWAPPSNGGNGAFAQSCVNGVCTADRGSNFASANMGPFMAGPGPSARPPNFGMPMMPPFMGMGPGLTPGLLPPNFAPQATGFPRPAMPMRAPGGMFSNANGGGQTIRVGGITIIQGPGGQSITF